MPTYDFKCQKCGKVEDYYVPISHRDEVAFFHCSEKMVRIISAPMVLGDYEEYSCPITGRPIRGRREHQENLKKHGCRVLEPGETQQFMKESEKRQKNFDKAVEETVEKAARDIGLNA